MSFRTENLVGTLVILVLGAYGRIIFLARFPCTVESLNDRDYLGFSCTFIHKLIPEFVVKIHYNAQMQVLGSEMGSKCARNIVEGHIGGPKVCEQHR